LLTLIACAVVLAVFPSLILKPEYDRTGIAIVVALWAAIMAVRALRTPEAVRRQAARESRPPAGASVWASLAALALTLALLLAFGPIASLLGVLIGDVVLTERVFALARAWKIARGWSGKNIFA